MEFTIKVPESAERVTMLGVGDRNLKIIREALGVKVLAREGTVHVSGERDPVVAARGVLERLAAAAVRSESLSRAQVIDLVGHAASGGWIGQGDGDLPEFSGPPWEAELDVYVGGQRVRPKTPNQQAYMNAMRDHDLIFGIGPAGTGKTYLAVAAAVHMLKHSRTKKVILCRPAVEAGERLGFLPGDVQAKVNPYLRPLLDALNDMMDFATIKRFMVSDVVEVIPLAYMRGRTLNNSVIILDEAQNTTRGQMQMFLTRMGHGSKMIVTGDTTQVDLPEETESGLIDAARRLRRIRGIAFCTLDQSDIVRHKLVQKIVEAYGDAGAGGAGRRGRGAEKLNEAESNGHADDQPVSGDRPAGRRKAGGAPRGTDEPEPPGRDA